MKNFWKERFIVGLPKLFGERILSKLKQHCGTDDILSFSILLHIFGVVKSEGLILCNELKIQAKYRSEKAQSIKEMGTFCEAFAITKIKVPSLKAKYAKKVINKRFKRSTKPPNNSPPAFNSKPVYSKKKKVKKKLVVCYKCGKQGYTAFQCKTEQKINELFIE